MKILGADEAKKLTTILSEHYKDAKYYLSFNTPLELIVAAILSAQTKDDVVNSITPALFERYKSAKDFANAKEDELIRYISKVSFAGNKAKNIIETCKIIENEYGGKVPSSMEELIKLPGVGRKTANTVLINAYGIVEGIPVDTWVIKLSYRLGLSKNKNPDKIEKDLMGVVDKKYWHNFAYVMKTHGKTLCKVVPICSKCPVAKICPKNDVKKTM